MKRATMKRRVQSKSTSTPPPPAAPPDRDADDEPIETDTADPRSATLTSDMCE
jgi:hypothetical protein